MKEREKVINALENCVCIPKCLNCHWEECAEFGHPVVNSVPLSLLQDALALLKEQEPRLLTLEEVKRSEIVYIEEFADPKDGVEPIIRPCIIVAVKNGFLIGIVDQEEDLTIDFFLDQYGIDWRCWSSRPTDEQRKAVKWE